jgi:hypothetical protein
MTIDFLCLLDEETRSTLHFRMFGLAGLLGESGNQVDEDQRVSILLGFLQYSSVS